MKIKKKGSDMKKLKYIYEQIKDFRDKRPERFMAVISLSLGVLYTIVLMIFATIYF